MRSTPRSNTITLSVVTGPNQPNDQHNSPHQMAPPRRRLLPWITAAMVVVALSAAGLGFWVTRPDAPPPTSEEPTSEPTTSATPAMRPATVGQSFDISPWRITVTSIKCGTRTDLQVPTSTFDENDTDRICVAAIAYINIDKVPHGYGSGFDTTTPRPEDTFLGFAGESAYVGHKWAAETVNPGLSQTNELIFKVPAGVTLDSVQIGDVLIKP